MSAIFISHSSRDGEAAAELRRRLRDIGHRSLFLDFDPSDGIPAGRSWERELYARLRGCQAVVVLCSTASMASDWCFAEITHARALGKHLFPLRIDDCEIRSLLGDVQIIDLRTHPDEGYARLRRGLEVAGLDPANQFDWDGHRPPYPGLLAFQEADAAIFFGRDAEIREGLGLLRRLTRFGGARTVLALGASGSGKSSLVRAGLVPRLRRDAEGWLVIGPLRPFDRPLDQLATALAKAHAERGSDANAAAMRARIAGTEAAAARALVDTARELRGAAEHASATVLLIVDQVEELLDEGAEADRFLGVLRAALEAPDTPLMVLGTLRSDFLGSFQQHPALRELDFDSLTIGPMASEGVSQVISGPAERAGIELAPGLVQAMVEDTAMDDALPLLAFTLRELWERYGDDGRLGVDEYREQLGGLEGSIAQAAEAVLAARKLTAADEKALRRSFLGLTRVAEDGRFARRPALWSELPERVHDLLERFVAGRLLMAYDRDGERGVEVAHEALLRAWARLRAWLEEDRAFLMWRKRVEEVRREWRRTGERHDALLQGAALAEASGWTARRGDLLSEDERAFIAASQRIRRRRRRRLLAATIAVFLVVAGFAGFAHLQRTMAEHARRVAHDQGLLVHARGVRQRAPADAADKLLKMIQPESYVHSIDLEALDAGGRLLAHSPDLMMAVLAENDGVSIRWVIDDRWAVRLPHPAPVYAAAAEAQPADILELLRAGPKRVLTAAEDGRVRLWELPPIKSLLREALGGQRGDLLKSGHVGNGKLLVTFEHDNERISDLRFSVSGAWAVSTAGDEVAVWKTDAGAEPLVLSGHRGSVTSVAFSPDERFLATTAGDGKARIWDLDRPFEASRVLAGHRAAPASAAFDSDSVHLVSVGRSREVRWWTVESGQGRRLGEVDCDPVEVAMNEANHAVVGCADGTARIIDPHTGQIDVLR